MSGQAPDSVIGFGGAAAGSGRNARQRAAERPGRDTGVARGLVRSHMLYRKQGWSKDC